MILIPDYSFADARPKLDVLVVPGGTSINDTLLDRRYLTFVELAGFWRELGDQRLHGGAAAGGDGIARWIQGNDALAVDRVSGRLGAVPVADERVVVDRNRVTASGRVMRGLILRSCLRRRFAARRRAQEIQLAIEYDPSPLFASGHPRTARAEMVAAVKRRLVPAIERRVDSVRTAAQRLNRQREMDRLLCM